MNQISKNELMRGKLRNFLANGDSYQDFFTPLFSFIGDKDDSNSLMRTDIEESKDNYTLLVEVPGVKKDEIKMSLEDGYLKISYSLNKEEKENQEKKIYHIERRRGYYSREYFVGYDISKENINASLDNGILTITIPKVKTKSEEEKYIKIN